MNDYKRIRRDPAYSKLRSLDTYTMHGASVRWLEASLAASNIHRSCEYRIGNTKVICNPHGYTDQKIPGLIPNTCWTFTHNGRPGTNVQPI
jgi:hypothetical protein